MAMKTHNTRIVGDEYDEMLATEQPKYKLKYSLPDPEAIDNTSMFIERTVYIPQGTNMVTTESNSFLRFITDDGRNLFIHPWSIQSVEEILDSEKN